MARNGKGLFQRAGVYAFRYRDPASGRWLEKSTGKKDLIEAVRSKDKFLQAPVIQATRQPELDPKAQQTLRVAAEDWLRVCKATKKPKTYSTQKSFIKQVVNRLGDRVLSTITTSDVEEYQLARLKDGVGGRAINMECMYLRLVLERAELDVKFPEFLKHKRTRKPVILTDDGAKRLTQASTRRRDWFVAYHASVLAVTTGLRSAEIRNLQLQNLLLDGPEPMIRVGESKTEEGEDREVPLSPVALAAAKALVERYHAIRNGHDENDYLLPSQVCKRNVNARAGFDFTRPMTSWGRAFRSLRKAAGLPKLRSHDLRHTAATYMAESDVSVDVSMSILGHCSPDMTRHYQHVRTKAKQKAIQAIAGQHEAMFMPATTNRITERIQ